MLNVIRPNRKSWKLITRKDQAGNIEWINQGYQGWYSKGASYDEVDVFVFSADITPTSRGGGNSTTYFKWHTVDGKTELSFSSMENLELMQLALKADSGFDIVTEVIDGQVVRSVRGIFTFKKVGRMVSVIPYVV